ncbi:MAG TPA: nuclear transport factor 2 family protein [Gemmatimonadales bacterium]|nr:nuclear transport factor 2 family protein [Gemmatimonadales bacterium]
MSVRIGAAALLLIIAVAISGSGRRPAQRDRDGLEAIERQWLASEHDSAALGRILADDFLHPVPAGVFLTKAEHIDWAVRHPAPSGRQRRFDQLRIRRYGDVGLVTGFVISTGGDGREDRTVFTDIFVRRNGRWQAVNAQENAVQPMPGR